MKPGQGLRFVLLLCAVAITGQARAQDALGTDPAHYVGTWAAPGGAVVIQFLEHGRALAWEGEGVVPVVWALAGSEAHDGTPYVVLDLRIAGDQMYARAQFTGQNQFMMEEPRSTLRNRPGDMIPFARNDAVALFVYGGLPPGMQQALCAQSEAPCIALRRFAESVWMVEDPASRAYAFAGLARAQFALGLDDDALQTMAHAVSVNREVAQAGSWADGEFIRGLLETLIDQGRWADVNATVQDLPAEVDFMARMSSRDLGFRDLAIGLAQAAHWEDAVYIAHTVIEAPSARRQAMVGVASAMAAAGLSGQAMNQFEDAWALTQAMAAETDRERSARLGGLIAIARAMGEAGFTDAAEARLTDLADGLDRAAMGRRDAMRLGAIGLAFAAAGNTDRARELVAEVVDFYATALDEGDRDSALTSFAETLVEEGFRAEVPAIAQQITETEHRLRVVIALARAMAEDDERDAAQAMLLEAAREAAALATNRGRGVSLRRVARAQAQLHFFDDALATVAAFGSSGHTQRARALSSVARAQAQAGLITEAEQTASLIEERSSRAFAWAEIAIAYGMSAVDAAGAQ